MSTTTGSQRAGASVLGLDSELAATCVSCGLCLPHCPTFRVTGEERYSPRGRIDAMRAVERGELPIDDEFVDFVETCVQCRGCETACPSGVQFGALMEQTRTTLAEQARMTPWWQRLGLRLLPRHRVLLAGSTAIAVAQRFRVVPKRLGIPHLALRRPPKVETTGEDVWLFTGCVMDAWQRDTHRNTAALIALAGATHAVPESGGGCCGALHAHAGLHSDAATLAERVMASMPGNAPILVNSAGCGAAMKEYGRLLDTEESHRFSARVLDISEWLAGRIADLPDPAVPRRTIIVQDPCHLRHVQRAHEPVRTLIGHVAEVVELDDDGLCCGAGGAYSALQPSLAGEIRERKVASIRRATERSDAVAVASANPGCSMHLGAVLDLPVRHPVDLVAEALGVDGR
ncbi:MAG: (Fe-S)-binding protein [Ilumatobacteraceae bacterium]